MSEALHVQAMHQLHTQRAETAEISLVTRHAFDKTAAIWLARAVRVFSVSVILPPRRAEHVQNAACLFGAREWLTLKMALFATQRLQHVRWKLDEPEVGTLHNCARFSTVCFLGYKPNINVEQILRAPVDNESTISRRHYETFFSSCLAQQIPSLGDIRLPNDELCLGIVVGKVIFFHGTDEGTKEETVVDLTTERAVDGYQHAEQVDLLTAGHMEGT